MGKVKEPLPVKLVVGMISGEDSLFEQAEKKLTQEFGLVDFTSSPLPFDCTDYYERKMQINLKRKFISFTSLIDPAKIVEIKLFTNQLEENFLYPHSKQRRLNLDPGYITLAKLVLATSKNFQHRIYLRKGIYAEITLRYNLPSAKNVVNYHRQRVIFYFCDYIGFTCERFSGSLFVAKCSRPIFFRRDI